MFIKEFWIGIALGVILGGIVSVLIFALLVDRWYAGWLREDRSIPEEPYYFMEIAPGKVHKLAKNKRILLNTKRENYLKRQKQDG